MEREEKKIDQSSWVNRLDKTVLLICCNAIMFMTWMVMNFMSLFFVDVLSCDSVCGDMVAVVFTPNLRWSKPTRHVWFAGM